MNEIFLDDLRERVHILRNPLYTGTVRWNVSQFVRDPDSEKYKRRARPKAEWHTYKDEALRIISDALDDELPKEVERLLAQKTIAGKLGAAAKAVFQRPGSALDFIKLQDDALKASDRLAKFLTGLVVQLGP